MGDFRQMGDIDPPKKAKIRFFSDIFAHWSGYIHIGVICGQTMLVQGQLEVPEHVAILFRR